MTDTSSAVAVHGTADERFASVAETFASVFEGRPTMGGALAIVVDGEPVVDLWAGVADATTGDPWGESTRSVIFSCSKGVSAIVLGRLVADGVLDYDDAVARHWPEFAVAGKAGVTIGDVLSHRAGLSAPRNDLSLDEVLTPTGVADALAAQSPLWEPGTAYSYHALTQGWLLGEIVRRATGSTIGELLARDISGPLGADVSIGLPESARGHVATMHVGATLAAHDATTPEGVPAFDAYWSRRAMTLGSAFPSTLVDGRSGFNDPRVQATEIPAAGGVATARGLATVWAAVADARILDDGTRQRATRVRSQGAPHFAAPGPWPRWGMGFQLDSEARRYLTPTSLGHDGAGGQVAFADPDHRVGFAFLTNEMEAGDDRATRVVDALREVLVSR